MEGSGVDSAGCVAHVDVRGECYVVEAVECMPQCMSSAGSVRHVGVCIMLQTFMLLDMADIGCLVSFVVCVVCKMVQDVGMM